MMYGRWRAGIASGAASTEAEQANALQTEASAARQISNSAAKLSSMLSASSSWFSRTSIHTGMRGFLESGSRMRAARALPSAWRSSDAPSCPSWLYASRRTCGGPPGWCRHHSASHLAAAASSAFLSMSTLEACAPAAEPTSSNVFTPSSCRAFPASCQDIVKSRFASDVTNILATAAVRSSVSALAASSPKSRPPRSTRTKFPCLEIHFGNPRPKLAKGFSTFTSWSSMIEFSAPEAGFLHTRAALSLSTSSTFTFAAAFALPRPLLGGLL
mmetsp:Transcript_27183/g.63251  ORF Transcript_27183/g.63251 Transcript_27183/m.63251 type:complete len:272 (-) Transcript_27183:853-1668(-)